MKNLRSLYIIIVLISLSLTSYAQTTKEPWSTSELMPPKLLADHIEHAKKPMPLVINIGPQAVIKGSVDVGPGSENLNIKKLESLLSREDKNREVVIYCGCCPFDRCPNIRPAFTKVKQMGFKNAKLLNIPKNIKTDWIDKNYPVQ